MSESRPIRADALLRRIEWTSLKRLDGLLQGDYRTLFRGAGLDLADLREYQFQDDVRRIDWNATARLGVPHVRDYLEDRELTAWFVLDTSGSLDFGSGRVSKREQLAAFTALLGSALMRHGNRIGAITDDGHRREVISPRCSRTHLLQVLERATRVPARASTGKTRLAEMLAAAPGVVRRRSLVVVVSDFISDPGWEAALARLAMRHEVVAVRIVDPVEDELPDIGLAPLRDAETGEWLMVDTHDRALRERYARLAVEFREHLAQAFASAGIDALELWCDDELALALFEFIRQRKQRSRLAAGASSVAMATANPGPHHAPAVA